MRSRGKTKEGKLVVHLKSKSHRAALERYHNFLVQKKHIDLILDSRRQQAEQEREAVFKYNCTFVSTLIDVSRFLSRQSLAFRGHPGDEGEGIFSKQNGKMIF